jgi:ankyrin repeat protein
MTHPAARPHIVPEPSFLARSFSRRGGRRVSATVLSVFAALSPLALSSVYANTPLPHKNGENGGDGGQTHPVPLFVVPQQGSLPMMPANNESQKTPRRADETPRAERPEPKIVTARKKLPAVAAKPMPLPLRPYREMTVGERATYDMVALLSDRSARDPKQTLTLVRKMIAAGANPNACAMDGVTPLVWVLFDYQDGKEYDPELVRLLVKKGANPDEVIRILGSIRPLMRAAENGWTEVVQTLLDAPKPPRLDVVDAKERTAMHYAAIGGNKAIVQALITAGSPLSTPDEDGRTPLHLAAVTGDAELVRILLEAGSDDTPTDVTDKSPLALAFTREHYEAAALLAASKTVPFGTADEHGNTVLHLAAKLGKAKVVQPLLANYAARKRSVDEDNKELCTPLYLAAEAGHLEIVKMLVEAGASMTEKGRGSLRPLDVARAAEHQEIVAFLREQMGEP